MAIRDVAKLSWVNYEIIVILICAPILVIFIVCNDYAFSDVTVSDGWPWVVILMIYFS
jgi:hypothetical protein